MLISTSVPISAGYRSAVRSDRYAPMLWATTTATLPTASTNYRIACVYRSKASSAGSEGAPGRVMQ